MAWRTQLVVATGSSPHTRGTPEISQATTVFHRFIPAYAGNAGARTSGSWPGSVHPRMRGERRGIFNVLRLSPGSSPHTRGTRRTLSARRSTMRFIPAYAGNAESWRPRRSRHAVHPRIRGERPRYSVRPSPHTGSSPHTRGTLATTKNGFVCRRFIPAYAGNAHVLQPGPALQPVHPRIRGERQSGGVIIDRCSGSSPHTRGTHAIHEDLDRVARFIPAYAGNAQCSVFRSIEDAVHPRIRGERQYVHQDVDVTVGSSPHTRGTPWR